MKKGKTGKKRRHPFIKGFLGCIAVAGVIMVAVSFMAASYMHGKMDFH